MIDFNNLSFGETDKPAVVRRDTHKTVGSTKITLEQLGIPRKLSITEAKQQRDELHKVEPGHKVAVLNVGTIVGCFCEHCSTQRMHVLKFDGSKIRCMTCKKDRVKTKKIKL